MQTQPSDAEPQPAESQYSAEGQPQPAEPQDAAAGKAQQPTEGQDMTQGQPLRPTDQTAEQAAAGSPSDAPGATGVPQARPARAARLGAGFLAGMIALPWAVLIALVRLYQLVLSPLLGRHCRFEPTCSAYFIEAVRKYGAVRGSWRGVRRILRCHPWNPGGYDPP